MQFKQGLIQGVVVKDLARHMDERGWLIELFRSDELSADVLPVMSYVSSTKPGITRGPHEHAEQADLFCFFGPSTFRLYVWDNRKQVSTYGNKMTIEAGEERPRSILIPARVVHAYKNIGNTDGWVINLPNRLYAGKGRKESVDEIRHEDGRQTIFIID